MAPAPRKKKIPKALREAVWMKSIGKKFEAKCLTPWCLNLMTVFDFQTSHNIPESKGGSLDIDNLFPLCSRCNQSMGNQYTLIEWCQKFKTKQKGCWARFKEYFFTSSSKAKIAPHVLNPVSTSTIRSKSLSDKSPDALV